MPLIHRGQMHRIDVLFELLENLGQGRRRIVESEARQSFIDHASTPFGNVQYYRLDEKANPACAECYVVSKQPSTGSSALTKEAGPMRSPKVTMGL